VSAYLDTDNDDGPDGATIIVEGGFFGTFHSPTAPPTTEANQEAAVQNLFYFNNVIHDELYAHGFDEALGNFQNDNFGRGGQGNDPVQAEAQDGGGINNANFATPLDGSSPRMQMYLWNTDTPWRDGDLDGDVVWHEYGHGLTWRIIDNMTGVMGGTIGEGAGDALAIIMYDHDRVGEYSYNNEFGIRSNPYDTYLEDTGRTYEDFVGEVHDDGEIYAAIMWDMWKRYRDDPDGAIGTDNRDQVLDDIVGGMILTTYGFRPTFPDMRDGILLAISGKSDPETPPDDPSALGRWCYVWNAFARYGVGVSQSTSYKTTGPWIRWTWFEAFDVPGDCGQTTNNTPPIAGDDGAITDEDVPVDIDVLANDIDADGDSLKVISVSDPGNGSAMILNAGTTVTYTPDPDFNGTDTFTYTVSDLHGGTDVATVTVTVNPVDDPPVSSLLLYPDQTIVTENLYGDHTRIDESPDIDDGLWMFAKSNRDIYAHFGFFDPGKPLLGGQGQQTFRLLVRKNGSSKKHPKMNVELWQAGAPVQVIASGVQVKQLDVFEFVWDAALLEDASGAGVEIVIVGTATGGAPASRRTIDIGAVEWVATVEVP
jgi:hypothetical protein